MAPPLTLEHAAAVRTALDALRPVRQDLAAAVMDIGATAQDPGAVERFWLVDLALDALSAAGTADPRERAIRRGYMARTVTLLGIADGRAPVRPADPLGEGA